jgi:hypothetical protein
MRTVPIDRRAFLSGCAACLVAVPALPAHAATEIGFNDLYERETVLTSKLQALNGQEIELVGYMAPSLKAEASFFVLTRTPMAVCPFCETEAQWPDDIVLVLMDDVLSAVPFNVRIRVAGRLDLGFKKDTKTGFVSLIRIESADFGRA